MSAEAVRDDDATGQLVHLDSRRRQLPPPSPASIPVVPRIKPPRKPRDYRKAPRALAAAVAAAWARLLQLRPVRRVQAADVKWSRAARWIVGWFAVLLALFAIVGGFYAFLTMIGVS